MYESLAKYMPDFHLYMFVFDDKGEELLKKLDLPHVTIIPLRDFEDKELLAIKPTRSKGDYCWTCTPSVVLYILNTYQVPSCIYLDADLLFFKSPEELVSQEKKSFSILITDHRYSKHLMHYEKSNGKFNVQFMFFKNDTDGRAALQWWRDACIEWCYDACEPGR